MSYFSGTFLKKFCGSGDHRPSNKPEPLHNDFWDTLYKGLTHIYGLTTHFSLSTTSVHSFSQSTQAGLTYSLESGVSSGKKITGHCKEVYE